MTGAFGATVSTLKLRGLLGLDVFAAASVAVATARCAPSAMAAAGMQVNAPLASAATVHTGAPSTVTRTVLLASAVPLKVGVDVESTARSAGVLSTGAEGAAVSTVNVL